MLSIPCRYNHFLFGVLQAGLTCGVAAAIASVHLLTSDEFVSHWLRSWLISWLLMLPVVILAAPLIRRLVSALTTKESA